MSDKKQCLVILTSLIVIISLTVQVGFCNSIQKTDKKGLHGPLRANISAWLNFMPVLSLGHFSLGDWRSGVAYLGGELALLSIGVDSEENIERNLPLILTQNLWFYSIYDAYRDARVLTQNEGYTWPVREENLLEVAQAPFDIKLLTSKSFWSALGIDFLGSLIIGYLILGDEMMEDKNISLLRTRSVQNNRLNLNINIMDDMLSATSIGVGEEALFRGYLQSELTRLAGPRFGLLTTSLLFGAAHIPNGNTSKEQAVAFLSTTLGGLVMGHMFKQDQGQLRRPVAHHAWFDFILFSIVSLSESTNSSINFNIKFQF